MKNWKEEYEQKFTMEGKWGELEAFIEKLLKSQKKEIIETINKEFYSYSGDEDDKLLDNIIAKLNH